MYLERVRRERRRDPDSSAPLGPGHEREAADLVSGADEAGELELVHGLDRLVVRGVVVDSASPLAPLTLVLGLRVVQQPPLPRRLRLGARGRVLLLSPPPQPPPPLLLDLQLGPRGVHLDRAVVRPADRDACSVGVEVDRGYPLAVRRGHVERGWGCEGADVAEDYVVVRRG